ncbi:MAG: bleomycin hydrolase [Lyngbya sp. HA4199-MV5]|jgi:phycoerythrin beta chain|nr:bleomycin hydrolase [Lyngbya sp. HA4199-MV5]
MKDVLQVIDEADSREAFISSQEFANLRKWMQVNIERVDVVQTLSNSQSSIVANAVAKLVKENSFALEPSHEHQMATCLRDCEIILRYITYALLVGNPSILDERCLNGLQETYIALGVSTTLMIRAVNLMKASVMALIDNADLSTEAVSYFDRVVISLGGEEPQPLWKQLVAIGNQVPEKEWAKLPTDLSRNFEHYMYGAPREE